MLKEKIYFRRSVVMSVNHLAANYLNPLIVLPDHQLFDESGI